MRHMNSVAWTLQHDPDAFDPLIRSMPMKVTRVCT